MTTATDTVWGARDTTPSDIEAAIRALEAEHHRDHPSTVSTRVLNLVVVVDRRWAGEIANRLSRVGRHHPSRTIVCRVEEGRTELDARATIAAAAGVGPGAVAPTRETVVVDVGARHLPALDTIVGPIVKTDVPTLAWAPHGHHEAITALRELSQIILVDSVDDPDPATAVRRALALTAQAYVVDLAWVRNAPWRERIAAAFDPPDRRRSLAALTALEVRHHRASRATALLLTGWLASRLGWDAAPLVAHAEGSGTRLRSRRGEVAVALRPSEAQDAPGLAGVTLRTADGTSLALDRGPGGLRATRVRPDGTEVRSTLLGASRGEAGILGEGIRQALLRDPTYLPSLRVAEGLVA